ncbi:MAG: hypothetical protein WDL87_08675 [Candidatus Omnitrophota bacterium]|jgi:hypothetical protein
MRKLMLILGIIILNVQFVFAQQYDKVWTGQGINPAWDDPENWSPKSIPQANEDVLITPGDNEYVFDVFLKNFGPSLHSLTVDGGMQLSIYSGTLDTTGGQYGSLCIGRDSIGALSQYAGNNYVNNLYLGYNEGGVGHYVMIGGANLYVSSSLKVGFESASDPHTGIPFAGGDGNFYLTNGNIYASTESIGSADGVCTGAFNQAGGESYNSAGFLYVCNGTYSLGDGGVLENEFFTLGSLHSKGDYKIGYGYFQQDGGLHYNSKNGINILNYAIYDLNGGQLSTDFLFVLGYVGVFNQNGGMVTNITSQSSIYNNGEYNLNNGILNMGNFYNGGPSPYNGESNSNSVLNYRGGSLNANIDNRSNVIIEASDKTVPLVVSGAVVNRNYLEVINSQARFVGPITNENTGTFKLTGSTVDYEGTFTDNGAYISDPSVNNFQADLNIGETGYLVGSVGDIFNLYADLHSASTSSEWNTQGATLAFFGEGNHQLALVSPQSLVWGTFELGAGAGIDFLDDVGSLQVNKFILADLSQLDNIDSNLNIFTNGIYKPGGTELYDLTGLTLPSNVTVTPEPISSVLFLIGAGVLTGIKKLRRQKA